MSILTKYLLRAHLGPFLFAFSVLTGMLFLNAVAQRIEDLAGKGLPWDIVAEFFVLSLPHIVALTLPMAVLVAVLYAFSELTSANEFTAMAAGGIKPQRLLVPMVLVGTLLSLVMLFFNDRILPETNHRLKVLGMDIGQKSPTFRLREQVVNEIETTDGQGHYFLQAVEIDNRTNRLRDVVIYDLSEPTRHRTIYADSASMAFSPSGTDLYLTLHDGWSHENRTDQPGKFSRLRFGKQILPLKGVGDVLRRQEGEIFRSDREMSIAMLGDAAEEKSAELGQIRSEAQLRSLEAVRRALGRGDAQEGVEADSAAATASRTGFRTAARLAARGQGSQNPSRASPGLTGTGQVDPVTRGVAQSIRTQALRANMTRLARNRYRVEIHKKFAIAFACVAFVLVGAPVAVRFPRGGVGMVITVSMTIFAIYWMGLIGGEKLADSGRLDPFWAMWTTDFLTLAVGVWLSLRMGREVSTNRGGGWEDLLHTMKRSLRRPFAGLARVAGDST